MTERELQDAVVECARVLGWLVHHTRPARTSGGWRTPVQGDAGFPDLVLARERVVFAELKAGRGRPTAAQEAWLARLEAAGAETYVWRDRHWRSGAVDETLRRRIAPPAARVAGS